MSIRIKNIPFVVLTVSLVACHGQEKTRTVDWYIENHQELEAALAACHANPGELAVTPNCINAGKAKNRLAWSARGRGIVLDRDDKESKP